MVLGRQIGSGVRTIGVDKGNGDGMGWDGMGERWRWRWNGLHCIA